MATVKIKFRPSTVENKEGVLYYQIIHKRVVRQINAKYKVHANEWNKALAVIRFPVGGGARMEYLTALKERLWEDVFRLKDIIARCERTGGDYTADKVVELYTALKIGGGFMTFARKLVATLWKVGKGRTAETYTSALNSFMRFCGGRDFLLNEIDSDLMLRYENYLKAEGVCPNTSSYYMRNLRAIYNRAVEKELIAQRNPFKHVYTGIDKTVKRALALDDLKRIKELDLRQNPTMDYARDIFMFSFYTRGMSFIDMAYLKKSDLRNGVLLYRRQKTGQQLFVKWEKPMQDIVNKYDTSGTPYLLPIIRDMKTDKRRQYQSASHLINAKLRKLGKRLKMPVPLTSYVARHSWANIAKSKNIPITVISEGMGHDSETTTQIYLASLDTSVVDQANSLILDAL